MNWTQRAYSYLNPAEATSIESNLWVKLVIVKNVSNIFQIDFQIVILIISLFKATCTLLCVQWSSSTLIFTWLALLHFSVITNGWAAKTSFVIRDKASVTSHVKSQTTIFSKRYIAPSKRNLLRHQWRHQISECCVARCLLVTSSPLADRQRDEM